ncbi:hypothetical protein [Mycolicibacterium fortuitum]
MDVMTRNEWRSATVEKLCTAANLNKRYFYESFTDLDGLAAAVVDDIADGVRSATVAAADAAAQEPLEVQAMASVAAAVRALVNDPRRARVLLGGVAALPESMPIAPPSCTGSPTYSSATAAPCTGSNWRPIRWRR